MKYLALSLLAVGIATAVQADESLLNKACSGALGETFVSKTLDAEKAEATARAVVTITRENATDDEWDRLLTYAKMMFGEPAATHKDQSLVFEFVREDKDLETWIKLLSNLEPITIAVRTSVENYAQVTLEM